MDAVSAKYLAADLDKNRHHRECMSEDQRIILPAQACKLGSPEQPSLNVLLLGDLHAMVTATAMEASARLNGSSFLFAASADCPIGLGFSIDPKGPAFLSSPSYRFCEKYNTEMFRVAMQPKHHLDRIFFKMDEVERRSARLAIRGRSRHKIKGHGWARVVFRSQRIQV